MTLEIIKSRLTGEERYKQKKHTTPLFDPYTGKPLNNGRAFKNLTPQGHEKKIIMPSKQEHIIAVNSQQITTPNAFSNTNEEDLNLRVAELKELLSQAKGQLKQQAQLPKKDVEATSYDNTRNLLNILQKENQMLSQKQQEFNVQDPTHAKFIENLERKRAQNQVNQQLLQQQLKYLESNISNLEQKAMEETQKKEKVDTYIKNMPKVDTPNVIYGVIMSPTGKGLSDIVIVIKNTRDEPVRALKTNSIGQFVISSALPAGSYKIVTDAVHNSPYNFDTIEVDVLGQVLEPIAIVGK